MIEMRDSGIKNMNAYRQWQKTNNRNTLIKQRAANNRSYKKSGKNKAVNVTRDDDEAAEWSYGEWEDALSNEENDDLNKLLESNDISARDYQEAILAREHGIPVTMNSDVQESDGKDDDISAVGEILEYGNPDADDSADYAATMEDIERALDNDRNTGDLDLAYKNALTATGMDRDQNVYDYLNSLDDDELYAFINSTPELQTYYGAHYGDIRDRGVFNDNVLNAPTVEEVIFSEDSNPTGADYAKIFSTDADVTRQVLDSLENSENMDPRSMFLTTPELNTKIESILQMDPETGEIPYTEDQANQLIQSGLTDDELEQYNTYNAIADNPEMRDAIYMESLANLMSASSPQEIGFNVEDVNEYVSDAEEQRNPDNTREYSYRYGANYDQRGKSNNQSAMDQEFDFDNYFKYGTPIRGSRGTFTDNMGLGYRYRGDEPGEIASENSNQPLSYLKIPSYDKRWNV